MRDRFENSLGSTASFYGGRSRANSAAANIIAPENYNSVMAYRIQYPGLAETSATLGADEVIE